jgi:hypothetical protein
MFVNRQTIRWIGKLVSAIAAMQTALLLLSSGALFVRDFATNYKRLSKIHEETKSAKQLLLEKGINAVLKHEELEYPFFEAVAISLSNIYLCGSSSCLQMFYDVWNVINPIPIFIVVAALFIAYSYFRGNANLIVQQPVYLRQRNRAEIREVNNEEDP